MGKAHPLRRWLSLLLAGGFAMAVALAFVFRMTNLERTALCCVFQVGEIIAIYLALRFGQGADWRVRVSVRILAATVISLVITFVVAEGIFELVRNAAF